MLMMRPPPWQVFAPYSGTIDELLTLTPRLGAEAANRIGWRGAGARCGHQIRAAHRCVGVLCVRRGLDVRPP